MRTRTVVIVDQGAWGIMKPGEYDEGMRQLEETLCALRMNPRTGKEEPAATVRRVPNLNALKEGSTPDVVIFRTRGMLDAARAYKREHPGVNVIVFTGLIPDGEVLLVSKGWALSSEAVRSIVLD